MCILLYRLDGEDSSHSFGSESIVETHPNPAGNNLVRLESYNVHCFVEHADFEHMAMTSQGTVIFYSWDGGTLFVDQEALNTGRLVLCDLENNGQVRVSSRVWPLWTYMMFCYMYGLGWSADRVVRDYFYGDEDADANDALDMELPILDILNGKQGCFDDDVDPDYWREAIEKYAPGYLEMEANGNGMAPDYHPANLRSDEELANMDSDYLGQ